MKTLFSTINLLVEKRYFFIAIIFVCFLNIIPRLNNFHDWGGDFSCYIMQAQAIVQNSMQDFINKNTITINDTIGYLSSYGIVEELGPIAYPWGFPLLLAPIFAIFGFNLVAFKAIGAIFLILILFILKKIFEKRLDNTSLLLLLSIFAFNPRYYEFAGQILSDIPFLFFSLYALYGINKIFIEDKNSSLLQIFILSFFIFYSFVIRVNGIAILATLVFMQILTFKFYNYFHLNIDQTKIYFLFYIFFIIFVIIWNLYFPSVLGGYSKVLTNITIKSILGNIVYYAFVIREFIPIKTEGIRSFFFAISIPLFIIGILNHWKRDFLYIIFSFFTLAIFIIFTARQGYRYIFVVIPFYFYFSILGFNCICLKFNFNLKQYMNVIIIFLFVLSLLSAYRINFIEKISIDNTPYTNSANEIWKYIKNNINIEDYIISEKPRVVRMLTQRNGFSRYSADKIFGTKAKYLLFNKLRNLPISEDEVLELVRNEKLESIFDNQEFSLFIINP